MFQNRKYMSIFALNVSANKIRNYPQGP